MVKAGKQDEIQTLLNKWGSLLLDTAFYLRPFMPDSAALMEKALRAERIVKAEPLFPKLI
jgi:methionyl-tRNA synthetase